MKLKTFFTEHAIDPEVTEAMVNGPDDVYVERGADWEDWVAQAR
jgi:type IV secretory pathway ATPase VirB11/archaellum biosynthesis ATPase